MLQINNSFSNQDYLPYSLGLLQACAQKNVSHIDDFEFLLPIYKRIPITTAVERLKQADIVVFSVYVWNFMLSLEIAKQIKKNKPQALMVFGGPHVPNKDTERFLHAHPFIDITCHGEGEINFPSLLKNYTKRDWLKVPAISYIDENGKFIQTSVPYRITDLNKIPSPYLEGVFEPLMKANPDTMWVGLWETNRGCPFSCTYCDWGQATKNKVYTFDSDRLFKEIDWFSKNKIEFIFCCDANFAILKRDLEIIKHFAENKRRFSYPKVFSVQSTKDFTEDAYTIYQELQAAGLNKGVSLSLQSLNKETLNNIKRKNIPIELFKKIQERLTTLNIETFTDIILGLPNETYESFVDGVSAVIENGQHNRIQFNNLSIVPNSEMSDIEYQKKFGFNLVETRLINIHGSLADDNEPYEIQQLVVGTAALPKEEWVRIRVFGWFASLLHFNKLLQIPFIILHSYYNIHFRQLLEAFIGIDKSVPILSGINSFFLEKAVGIQNGTELEFCESKGWLNIWWPADEFILINLCTENKLDGFYSEAKSVISAYFDKKEILDYQSILNESIVLNQSLIKLPLQEQDLTLHLSYNIWDVYYSALKGIKVALKKGEYDYFIDRTTNKWMSWEDWCREVIWYGNKRGAYLYNCRPCVMQPQKLL